MPRNFGTGVLIYKFKKRSKDRRRIWTWIAETLNDVRAVKFKVNQRAVRERFDLLIGRFRQQSKEEEKASGVLPDQTELDALLEEICEREALAESTRESCFSKKKDAETDRKKAEEMHAQALERVGETKKGQMKIVKQNPKGGKEAKWMSRNFFEKSQKRKLRSVKRSSL